MSDVTEKLIEEYKDKRPPYEEFSLKLEELIRNIMKEAGIHIHSVTSRPKEISAFSEKLHREGKEYTKYTDITDLSGVRIICLLSEDVDNIAEIVKGNFEVLPEYSVDKRDVMDPDRFGYLSLHFVIKLDKGRAELLEYKRFKDLLCEVQIRSVLQHAWAEIEHDLGYKSKFALPKDVRRRFYRLAGLLELADDEFVRLQEDIKEYTEKVSEKITTIPKDLLIDKVSLTEYITKSEVADKIDNAIAGIMGAELKGLLTDPYLKHLSFLGLKTISELDTALKQNSKNIVQFAKIYFIKRGYIWRGICLLCLGYILIAKTQDNSKINNYLEAVGFSIEKQREELSKTILDIYKQIATV